MIQFSADVSINIIDIILALVLFFVAAEVIIRKIIPGLGKPGEKISLPDLASKEMLGLLMSGTDPGDHLTIKSDL